MRHVARIKNQAIETRWNRAKELGDLVRFGHVPGRVAKCREVFLQEYQALVWMVEQDSFCFLHQLALFPAIESGAAESLILEQV